MIRTNNGSFDIDSLSSDLQKEARKQGYEIVIVEITSMVTTILYHLQNKEKEESIETSHAGLLFDMQEDYSLLEILAQISRDATLKTKIQKAYKKRKDEYQKALKESKNETYKVRILEEVLKELGVEYDSKFPINNPGVLIRGLPITAGKGNIY